MQDTAHDGRGGAVLALVVATLLALVPDSATAGDWPQILGPQRNATAEGERLLAEWPRGGPRKFWQREVGRGFAGVAVAGDQVVLFHRVDNEEILTALDAKTGEPLWADKSPTRYVSGIAPDDGPRCVPVIAGKRVIALGAAGELRCVDLASGRRVWSRDTSKEFAVPEGYFGVGSTPLVIGKHVLVNVGGKKEGGIVAFDLSNGKTVWQATDEQASYAAPTLAKLDSEEIAIFATRLNVVGIDPVKGEVRFRFPFGKRGPTVNAATPLVIDDHLFATASYGVGAVWAKLTKSSATAVWENDDSLSSQYTTPVYHDRYLYGIDGRQDQGVARLRCIDPRTGKVQWTEEGFGTGNLILAGDKLLAIKTTGELVLLVPSPKKYQPLAEAKVLDGTAQSLPALAHGKLYVRDDRVLKCLEVGAAAAENAK